MTIIKIDDEIGMWGISSRDIKRQLNEAKGDLLIEVNSPGGSVFEGLEIYNAIKSYDKGTVTSRIGALGASMGSIIPLAADIIEAHSTSTYMIHNALTLSYGNHNDLRKDADVLEGLSSLISDIYVEKTGMSTDEIKILMDNETYFFGNEILENKFVNKIIDTGEAANDKNSALAFAKERFKACVDSCKKNEDENERENIAAILKVQGVQVQKSPENSVTEEPISNKNKGETMSIEEQESIVALAISNERERVSAIMEIDCRHELKVSAIKDGMDVGAFGLSILATQKSEKLAKKSAFEAAGSTANIETPQVIVEDDKEAIAIKEANAAIE